MRSEKTQNSKRQKWIGMGLPVLLSAMVCLSVNYSAFSEWNKEVAEHESLETQVQSVIADNLAIQEQIHYLKHDPATIEREVKKFGLQRPSSEVSVQADR